MDIEEDARDRALASGWLRIMLGVTDEVMIESLTGLLKARRGQAISQALLDKAGDALGGHVE